MRFLIIILCLLLSIDLSSQTVRVQLEKMEQKRDAIELQLKVHKEGIIDLKHQLIKEDLKKIGLPSDDYIEHSAMILEYAEEHEQARWVAHMILPNITDGIEFRSNDYRVDSKISTGTAVHSDYLLTDTLDSGKVNYDGFGYDRGHLAPSADFRWSKKALSESYFYSNLSPQKPEFNQESWANLENHLRSYVIEHKVPLYIVTAPVLSAGLDTIARATNHLSIPETYVKAAYDAVNKKALGFIMPNASNDYPLEHYAVSVDEVEALIGLDLFTSLDAEIEKATDKAHWFTYLKSGDVEPIYQPSMPRHHFNTIVGGQKKNQKVTVCGTVVSTRYSKKGNLWMSLDKKFPNQLFSVMIRKDNLVNFDLNVKLIYENENICVKGVVHKYEKTSIPHIEITDDRGIKIYRAKADM